MKIKLFKLFLCSIFIVCILIPCISCNPQAYAANTEVGTGELEYIAHAGGSYLGYVGSNSMEALIESAERGYNLIEVDIMRTSDGRYILNHDWELIENRIAFIENSPMYYDTFLSYRIYNKLTPVGLDDLIKFLDEYKNVRIITDTKDGDYSVLYYIKEKYKEHLDRFIPQVYAFEDYDAIKKIGYSDIIITLYTMPYNIKMDAAGIYWQAKKLKPYAITVPDELLNSKEYIAALRTSEVKYFTHTINDGERAAELLSYGISGVYTDNLLAGDYIEYYDEKILKISENINNLSQEERDLLSNCLIYELGNEICLSNGRPSLIYADSTLVSPFENTKTKVAFLPLARTIRYLGGNDYRYIADSHSILFEYDSVSYTVNSRGFYRQGRSLNLKEKLISVCSTFSVPDKFFVLVFECNITKIDDYIIISKIKNKDTAAIAEILRFVMAN